LVGPEAYNVWEAHYKENNTNYEYKIRYERKYLFRMRKETTTNYKFIKSFHKQQTP